MAKAKQTFIITDMRLDPHQKDCIPQEFKSIASALRAAKDKLASNTEEEVWVWKLSHIVSRPALDPDVEAL